MGGSGANGQPGLPCLWLPSLSQVCPAQKAGWSLWQRHPQPCCHPALFKDNPPGAHPASISPPGKGELATPRVPEPACSSSLHLGLFWELLVQPFCLARFHHCDRDGESFASLSPALHPGKKVTTCLGDKGNGQLGRSPDPHTGHREGASSDGCCCPEPMPKEMGMPQATLAMGTPVAP